jgi:tripartite-type tricarboxylate transporter receptor subunit TctC
MIWFAAIRVRKRMCVLGLLLAVMIIFSLTLLSEEGIAQPTKKGGKSLFDGKEIHMVVYSAAGTSPDAIARIAAPMIEKYSGGRVTVLNVTGGGGTKAANQLARTNPTKGPFTIAILGTGIILPQLLKQPGLLYDVKKFVWLAQISNQGSAFFTGAKGPYKSIADLLKSKGFKEGSTGKGSIGHVQATLRKVALGWNSTIVAGYDTPQTLIMAVAQGEIDAASLAYPIVKTPADSKQVIILATRDPVPPEIRAYAPELSDIPAVRQRVTEEGIKQLDLVAHMSLGRSFTAPPGTPDTIRLEWDRVLKQVAEDPWFRERAERTANTPGFETSIWVRDKVMAVYEGLERYKDLIE